MKENTDQIFEFYAMLVLYKQRNHSITQEDTPAFKRCPQDKIMPSIMTGAAFDPASQVKPMERVPLAAVGVKVNLYCL